jgi:hypothetical protein
MGKPANLPKPDMSRLTSRQMTVSTNRNALEAELYGWVCDIVRETKQPPADDGMKAEMYLMSTAKESIDVLMQSAPLAQNMNMAFGGSSGGKQTVHADFHWLRTTDGRWLIDQVCFALVASAAVNQIARQRAVKQMLLEKAELRNESHINLRKIAFPVEDMPMKDYPLNLSLGDFLIQDAIELAHDNAKEDAKMLENPVEPKDMMLDLVGMGVGHIAGPEMAANKANKGIEKGVEELSHDERFLYEGHNFPQILGEERMAGAKSLGGTFEKTSHSIDWAKLQHGMRNPEKSAGDKLIDTGLTLASYAPGGPWIKMIAGMMFDIAISSDAARITKIRSRCYVFFVAGFIKTLALIDTGRPVKRLDKKYFDLGVERAPRPGSPGSLRTQLSLMHYASDHYTDGGWGGLSYKKQNWQFPDQYIIKWSPDLLGRAMATQLHRREYLID